MTSPTTRLTAPPTDAAATARAELGALPLWNLTHLYPGMVSDALKADIAKADTGQQGFCRAVPRHAGCAGRHASSLRRTGECAQCL